MLELNRELLHTACRITQNGHKFCTMTFQQQQTDKQTHKQLILCPIFISGKLTNTGLTSSFTSSSWLPLQDAGYSSAPGSGSIFMNSILCWITFTLYMNSMLCWIRFTLYELHVTLPKQKSTGMTIDFNNFGDFHNSSRTDCCNTSF